MSRELATTNEKEASGHWHSSVELEQALIGAVLVNNHAYHRVSDFISPDHFGEPLHKAIWYAISDRMDGGGVVDPALIKSALSGGSEPIKGLGMNAGQYMAFLAANAITVAGALDYAKTIVDYAKKRQAFAIVQEAQAMLQESTSLDGANELIDEAVAKLTQVRMRGSRTTVQWIGEAAQAAVAVASVGYQSGGKHVDGIDIGLAEIDSRLGSLMPGDLVTLLSPSGGGKTALMAQICMRAATTRRLDAPPVKAGMFQMEMQGVGIARRVIAGYSGIRVSAQKSGDMNQAEFEEMIKTAGQLKRVGFMVDENGRQTMESIEAQVRSWRKIHDVRIVAIDHIKLLRSSNPKLTLVERIGENIQRIKECAKENGVVMLVGVQLTRSSQVDQKTWRITDQAAYGGDEILQASDVMLGVVSPLRWLKQREPDKENMTVRSKWEVDCEAWRGLVEIGGLKVRDDESGWWIKANFDGARYQFSDYDRR